MKHKTGKNLDSEYRELLDKTKALRVRIVKRAEELTKNHPDVIYIEGTRTLKNPLTVSEYIRGFKLEVNSALSIIKKIEKYIADQHPHKQMEIDFS